MKRIEDATNFDELIDIKYGKIGTHRRDEFEMKSINFIIAEILKDERKKTGISQNDLALKIGADSDLISNIEKGLVDISLSTLYNIFEKGLGKQIRFTIL